MRGAHPSSSLFPTFPPASPPPGSGPPRFWSPNPTPSSKASTLCLARHLFLDPLTALKCKLPSSHPSPAEEGRPQQQAPAPLPREPGFPHARGTRTRHFRHADGGRWAQSRPRPREAPNQNRVPLPTRSPGRRGWGACACAQRALVRDSWRRVAATELEAVATVARS